MSTQITERQSLDCVYQPVLSGLSQILVDVRSGRQIIARFNVVSRLLESLPLATDEFALARTRIANACRYSCSNEPGASTWEIRHLLNQLRTIAEMKTVEPRRRLRQPLRMDPVFRDRIHSLVFNGVVIDDCWIPESLGTKNANGSIYRERTAQRHSAHTAA